MKKTLLALSMTALVITPAIADNKINFVVHVKTETSSKDDGSVRKTEQNYTGTRVGVNGGRDLDNGNALMFRLQGNISPSDQRTQKGGFGFNEEVWGGVKGNWGELRVGRSDTPHKLAIMPFRKFTDDQAESVVGGPAGLQRRDGWHYRTPSFSGLSFNVSYAPTEFENEADYGISSIYRVGDVFISAFAETNGKKQASDKAENNIGAGIHYKARNFTIGLLYEGMKAEYQGYGYSGSTNAAAPEYTRVMIPGTYSLGAVQLKAAVTQLDYKDKDKATDYVVGGEYFFDKKTRIYANIWTETLKPDTGVKYASSRTQYGIGFNYKY